MKRKEILPAWIRFFSWFFLLMAVTPVIYVAGLVWGFTYNITAFGLIAKETNSYSPLATYLAAILTLSAVVAYGILWGKNWAIRLGMVYGIIALVTSFYSIYSLDGAYLDISPLFLIPFVWVLWIKRIAWAQYTLSPVL
jgi:membrane-associated HD superfamily phosphohydrolase